MDDQANLVEPAAHQLESLPTEEHDFGLVHSAAFAAALRCDLPGLAPDAVGRTRNYKVELHRSQLGRVGVVAPDVSHPVAHAGHAAVEGEAERVEDAGFACAGFAVHEEQACGCERGEVHDLGASKRSECREFEAQRAHQAMSASGLGASLGCATTTSSSARRCLSTTSERRASSSAETTLPRACATKSRAMAMASLPATRS